jgi:hypothetical protein
LLKEVIAKLRKRCPGTFAPSVDLWVSAKANSVNPVLKGSKFDEFSLNNDQEIDKFATERWKLVLAEGQTLII